MDCLFFFEFLDVKKKSNYINDNILFDKEITKILKIYKLHYK